MIGLMTKETRLNLRITDDFRRQIETLAEYHGLSLSSYAHSLLVKGIRRERSEHPDAFSEPARQLAPVVATISPVKPTREEIAEQFKETNDFTITHKRPGVLSDESEGETRRKAGSRR